METLEGIAFDKPFPHLIIENFYNKEELELVWEEFKFLTKPNKLLEAKDYGGVVTHTNSHALILDSIYNNRNLSNILQVNRKLFTCGIINEFCNLHPCCSHANICNSDLTKIRYYHEGEYYQPHVDIQFDFLSFSYFK